MGHLLVFPKLGLLCALMLFGALISCTPATPVAVPTLTLVPNTATATPTPITPPPTSTSSQTPVSPSTTPQTAAVRAILETAITPDAAFVQQLMNDLAQELTVSESRVQFVSVEMIRWLGDGLGCDMHLSLADDATFLSQHVKRGEGYRYLLLVGNTVYTYHVADNNDYQRCEETDIIRDDLLLAVDPVALDIVQLTRQRVATDLDLSTRRVQLLEVVPYNWPDASLGCPQVDQDYSEGPIPGYRVVVSVGGNDLAFHSDSTTIIPCPSGQESLPLP